MPSEAGSFPTFLPDQKIPLFETLIVQPSKGLQSCIGVDGERDSPLKVALVIEAMDLVSMITAMFASFADPAPTGFLGAASI